MPSAQTDSEDLAGLFREVIRSRDSAATRMQRGRWSGRLRVPGAFDDNADFKDRGCAAAFGSSLAVRCGRDAL